MRPHSINRSTLARSLISAVLSLLFAASCSVVETSPVFEPNGYYPVPDRNCESSLGSYVLPKTKLAFTIRQNVNNQVSVLQQIKELRVPDDPQRYTFCLDFLENGFANDKVQVRRTSDSGTLAVGSRASGGFLDLVASHSVDMTGVVLTKIIRAIFIYLSGNADFVSGRTADLSDDNTWTTVLEPTIDPFDAQSMAQWNKSMRRYGFCIALSDFTFNTETVEYGRYCSDPVSVGKANPPLKQAQIAAIRNAPIKNVPGIYYRPRVAYPITIFVNPDPLGRGEWRPGKTVYVEMENISPVLALRINRAFLAVKKTALIFDQGRLRDVCLVKGSEAQGAVKPIVELVSDLVQLPSATISAEIALLQKSQSVYAAEQKVIEMQNRLIELKQAQLERNVDAITKLATENTASGQGELVYSDNAFPKGTEPKIEEPKVGLSVTQLDSICDKLKDKNGPKFSAYFNDSFADFQDNEE
ncbi:hypothetical protein EOA23_00940 [Mesorhizobium sp. M2A.F.Ca.ET.042.01.1.1]|uniref:hypothetical protein n=1 Tax=Mesorhizobium sp. M2A.F.Ca.ET.042.01.1.1 TaxID=2496745 RepID=UPI000FCCDD84|nr:hypothetical protein [Mesorhizobium sp. M2A.F.Ca.ET.042.01.1.1]RUX34645.1 hypothetical protein EOA23_00940 [Mesorhizobium sp. M2A.F.Ca.ET.042.01.1.1]